LRKKKIVKKVNTRCRKRGKSPRSDRTQQSELEERMGKRKDGTRRRSLCPDFTSSGGKRGHITTGENVLLCSWEKGREKKGWRGSKRERIRGGQGGGKTGSPHKNRDSQEMYWFHKRTDGGGKRKESTLKPGREGKVIMSWVTRVFKENMR